MINHTILSNAILNHKVCSIFLTSITSSMNSKRNIIHTIIIMKVNIKQTSTKNPQFHYCTFYFLFSLNDETVWCQKHTFHLRRCSHFYYLKFFAYQTMRKNFVVADIVSTWKRMRSYDCRLLSVGVKFRPYFRSCKTISLSILSPI